MNFNTFLTEYEQVYVSQLAATTRARYASNLNRHIRPAFGALDMEAVSTKRIELWLADLKAAGLSWGSRMSLRNVLSGVFAVAARWGEWDRPNPVKRVVVGRRHAVREQRKLSLPETRSLLAELPADVRLIAEIALFATLRISEVLGLCWKHLDLDRGVIHVRQRYWRGDLDVTKSDRAARDVPMGSLVEDFRRLPGPHPSHEFVCRVKTHHGCTRDDRSIRRYFLRPAAERLGIYWPGFGFHSLRREAVTAIAATAGPFQAMRAAGHSHMDTTLLYGLADFERQEAAIRTMQASVLG